MTTGKDYGLPEEYADWVEVKELRLETHGTGPFLAIGYVKGSDGWIQMGDISAGFRAFTAFVPPNPKPTLPDVGPGAVVRYVDKTKLSVRAVLRSGGVWDTYRQPHAPLNTGCTIRCLSAVGFLADVNDDGFTVELEGL